MIFKKSDYIIFSIICFFLGLIIVSQFLSTNKYNYVIQPENNAVLALEVSKQTKVNADLRREVQDLTTVLEEYKNSAESNQKTNSLYLKDMERLAFINGEKSKIGQGVIVTINGDLSTAQLVDLVNAIKNIGADIISINDTRLTINTNLNQFVNRGNINLKVIGNSKLLKTAMNRKGGIVEQISSKDIAINIDEKTDLEIPTGKPIQFKYSKIIE